MAGARNPRDRKARAGKAAAPAAAVWQRLNGSLLVYRGGGQDSGQAWLLTFTDLAALMLTFFVLLFSMSTIKEPEWQNLIDAFSPNLSGLQEVTIALPTSDETADAVERIPGTDLDYLAAVLREQMAANENLAGSRVRREAERLVISVPGDLLFAPGAIALGATGEKAVFALSGVLRNLRNVVEVAGHADPNRPGSSYPSNWELSLARASVISGLLSDLGYAGQIVVRGYGHSRYEEVDSGLAGIERRALARRVDIIVHSYAAEVR